MTDKQTETDTEKRQRGTQTDREFLITGNVGAFVFQLSPTPPFGVGDCRRCRAEPHRIIAKCVPKRAPTLKRLPSNISKARYRQQKINTPYNLTQSLQGSCRSATQHVATIFRELMDSFTVSIISCASVWLDCNSVNFKYSREKRQTNKGS